MCASTDEELLDGEEWSSATHKPPPVPPRTKSVTSIGSIEESDNPGHPDNVLPHPPKSGNAVDSVVLSSPPVVPPKRHAWAHTVSESAISNSFSPPVSSHPAASVPLRAPKPPVSPRTKSPKPNTGASSSSISGLSSSAPSTHGIRSTSELHKSKSEYNIKLPQYSTKFFEGDSDDSDSSDDFEHFEPPKRSRYSSEPFVHQQILHCQMRERRLSSPAPQKPLNKSSPILTKRPGWYPKPDKQALQRKYNSEISFQSLSGAATLHGQVQHRQDTSSSSRRAKARSRSLDDKTRSSVSRKSSVGNLSINPIHGTIAALKHSQSCDSDDCTGGTIDSTGYSKPFEHILWRKLGLEDGSALSGSMPHLTQLCNELDAGVGGTGCDGGASEAEEGGEGEEGEECTYLDPTELEEYCKKLGGNKELTARVRTRMSTVLCKTYLTLQNVASITGKDASTTKTPSENRSFVVSSGFLSPPLPSGCPKPPPRRENTFHATTNSLERLRTMDLAEHSGYSTDASSGWGEMEYDPDSGLLGRLHEFGKSLDNPYDEIKNNDNLESDTASTTAREEGEEEGEGEDGEEEEQIYEEIDDYSNINQDYAEEDEAHINDCDEFNSSAGTESNSAEYASSAVSPSIPIITSGEAPPRSAHPQLHVSQSVPADREGRHTRCPPCLTRQRRVGMSPARVAFKQTSSSLEETTLGEGQKKLGRAPTLPPRPLRKKGLSSMDPSEAKKYFRSEQRAPVVSLTYRI